MLSNPLSYTQKSTKWIKDLCVRPKTIKLLKGNIGRKLRDVGFGNDFLDLTPKARATKAKLGNWDHHKASA